MQRRAFLGLVLAGSASTILNAKECVNSDIELEYEQITLFLEVHRKVELVKRYVGYGNFNILSFDDMLKVASRYSKIGAFTLSELDFMEEMFYGNPKEHGFYGKKTLPSITTCINKKDVKKIRYTGHYLFKGHPEESYNRILKDVGTSIKLTSGVRGVPKQLNLYLNKIKACSGNITKASHSIAPPAYSYHSIGDFDVGKKGWGYKNFTSSFARTDEFFRLRKLSYISMRYNINNHDGVRFEPWHVKIV